MPTDLLSLLCYSQIVTCEAPLSELPTQPPPQTSKPARRRRTGGKRRKRVFTLPIEDTLGFGLYRKRNGEQMPIAIRSRHDDGKYGPYYRVLFIDDETNEAYHPQGGFNVAQDTVTEITWLAK